MFSGVPCQSAKSTGIISGSVSVLSVVLVGVVSQN